MINIILLNLLLNKDYFNKYHKIINLEYFKQNNKELFKLFLTLFDLHKTSEASLTTQDLALGFYTNYPLTKDDERVIIDATLAQVDTVEVDEAKALDYLNKHNVQTVSTQIAIKALEVSQGKADIGTVRELLDSLEEVVEESPEDLFVTDDLELLVNDVMESQGLRWRLQTMNKMVGSLRKGDFGFIMARPECGKTSFLASEVTYMAQQAREQGLGPVLWANNEQMGSRVMLRCYQGVFGITQQELYTNLPHYKDEYASIIGNHIKIYDNARIEKKEIERICEELQPSVIIFDQLDKVIWPDADRYDLKMKAIYQWARELAKKYGVVIGVSQAGGTAEGKKYLTMNDVDSSHTAKAGEADFMIGIGKTNTDGEEFLRFLSICKNKLAGDTDTLPELRHGKMPVVFNADISRYEDSTKWQ
jgi:replicative DNA helicase